MLKNMTKALFSLKNAPRLAIIFLLFFYCLTNFTHMNWKQVEGPQRGAIKWDVISYYSYLPAIFIYHDLSLDFTEEPGFNNDNKFWFQKTEKGKKVIITSMGLSYLYAPFFFVAHALAPAFGEARDGFQSIYQFFLVFGLKIYGEHYAAETFVCLRFILYHQERNRGSDNNLQGPAPGELLHTLDPMGSHDNHLRV